MNFGAPEYLPLVAVPGALLLLWFWQVARRRADARAFLQGRRVPVNERVPFFGELLFWLCLLLAATASILALARPQAVTSLIRSAGVDLVVLAVMRLAAADPELIGRLGIVRQRVKALQALAAAVAAGDITLHRGAPLPATLDALRALPGIGDWTAQVIAMRALAWPDAWPATDIGLINALGGSTPGAPRHLGRDARHITLLAEAWRPWRAYAVMRLWHSLETSE